MYVYWSVSNLTPVRVFVLSSRRLRLGSLTVVLVGFAIAGEDSSFLTPVVQRGTHIKE